MRHHHPLGWAATIVLAVVYAHVLIELAAVVGAAIVVARVMWARRRACDRCRTLELARVQLADRIGRRHEQRAE